MTSKTGQNQGSPDPGSGGPTRSVPVAIGVLVDRSDAGPRVLLSKRHDDAVLGGLWELPGGKIEADETPAAALVREFREELGLAVTVDRPIMVIEHDYPHATVRLHAFYCSLIDPETEPRSLQVADHRWVEASRLPSIAFPPANGPLIEAVVRELTFESD